MLWTEIRYQRKLLMRYQQLPLLLWLPKDPVYPKRHQQQCDSFGRTVLLRDPQERRDGYGVPGDRRSVSDEKAVAAVAQRPKLAPAVAVAVQILSALPQDPPWSIGGTC